MSYNHSGKWASLVMTVDGTLAVADSQASVKMPFDGYIESVQMCVKSLGSGSAATEVMLANGSNDLWAANTLQQAHDATDGATSVIGRSDFNSSGTALFSEGAQLDLDIDEVAGTAGTGPLTVHVIVVGN
jgi:hypothetical protein|tara:strand:- start:1168 stop:1557 length:390 start_codon:yes stop_codon:yes gene_type:complete